MFLRMKKLTCFFRIFLDVFFNVIFTYLLEENIYLIAVSFEVFKRCYVGTIQYIGLHFHTQLCTI